MHSEESSWKFVHRPDPKVASALLYGADPVLVNYCRGILAKRLLGGQKDGFISISPAEAQRSWKAILVKLTQPHFFEGGLVGVLDGAGDRHTKSIEEALKQVKPGDSFLLVTAGDLRPTSSLRKFYEGATGAAALRVAPPKWSVSDIRQRFVKASLPAPHPDASAMLANLSHELDWGTFEMLLKKLDLYQQGRSEALTVEDIDACTPSTGLDNADELVDAVATHQIAEAATCWRRMTGVGTAPSELIGAMLRHLVLVRSVAARARSSKDIEYVARSRRMHPLRRGAVIRDARHWPEKRLEDAISHLLQTDAGLRGGSAVPPSTLGERALLRIASLAPKGNRA